ncbi:MAG: hypothetical protein PSX36_05660 [bacterium]|nr:hypothetical protein [bacterium]
MRIEKLLVKDWVRTPINVLSIVLLVVAVFSHLWPKEAYLTMFFSSDALYLPSLYKDLISDGSSIKTWHLNPSPNFFPDMIFYFLLMALTNSFIWATFIFALVQYLAMALLISWIFRIIFPGRSASYQTFIFVFMSMVALEFLYRSHDLGYTFLVLINSYHNGAFVSALFCFALTLKYLTKQKNIILVYLFVIVFLSVFSDRLFVVLFPIPLVLSLMLILRRKTVKPVGLLITVVVSAVFFGLFYFNKIDNNTYVVFKPNKFLDAASITESYHVFMKQMGLTLSSLGFKALMFYLFFISLPFTCYIVYRSYRKEQQMIFFSSGFSLIFSFCVIFSPIINGKYSDYSCLRYSIFPVFLAGLNISMFVAFTPENRKFKFAGKVFVNLLVLLVVAAATVKIDMRGLQGYFSYYPNLVRQIDNLAEKENLQYGAGNYWVAKYVTLFSRKGVKIRSVFDDISIYDHVSNDAWFFNNIFTFVVLNRFNDTTLYRQKLKGIKIVNYDKSLKLVRVSPFTYRRETGYRAQNIGFIEE